MLIQKRVDAPKASQQEAKPPKQSLALEELQDMQQKHTGNGNIIRVKFSPGYIGVARATYHNFRNSKSKYFKKDFPALIVLGDNSKGHKKSELDAWLESRKEETVINGEGDSK